MTSNRCRCRNRRGDSRTCCYLATQDGEREPLLPIIIIIIIIIIRVVPPAVITIFNTNTDR